MAEIDMTTVSSKGQVVIPASMRKGLKNGERLVIIHNKGQYILKKADSFAKNIQEDLEFAARAEKAWKGYLRSKPSPKSKERFLAEMEKW